MMVKADDDATNSRNPTKLIETFELLDDDGDPGVEGTVFEPVAPTSMKAFAGISVILLTK